MTSPHLPSPIWKVLFREVTAGYIGLEYIPLYNWQQQVRRVLGIVMVGNPGSVLPPLMSHVVPLQRRDWLFIVYTRDPNGHSAAGFKEDTIRRDFDVEFINLIRCQ